MPFGDLVCYDEVSEMQMITPVDGSRDLVTDYDDDDAGDDPLNVPRFVISYREEIFLIRLLEHCFQ